MGRLWYLRSRAIAHRVMVLQSWWLGGLRCTHVLWPVVWLSPFGRSHCGTTDALSSIVLRVVEECAYVVNEEWIQLLCDLLLVCKIESTLIRNPDTLEMHWANLDDVSRLFTLENTISSASGHASNIQEFGSIDEVVVCDNYYEIPN